MPAETEQRMEAFLVAGFDCFVDLTAPGERDSYDQWVPRTSLYLRKPIPDHDVPRLPDHMAEILVEIEAALREGRQVYVHCRAGIGRTGTVVGCYLVNSGLEGDAALVELNRLWAENERSRYWEEVPETPAQKEFVRTWRQPPPPPLKAAPLLPPPVSRSSEPRLATTAQSGARERFLGSFIGLAVGDALAAATQFRKPGTFSPVGDLLGGGPFAVPRGAWTDDTAMALVLAESLHHSAGFDANDQVARYGRWQKEGYLSATGECSGITASVSRALATAKYRRQPFAGSHDPAHEDKEVLSRVVATVMYFFADGREAVRQSVEAARITNQAPLVLDCVRLFAAMLHQALAGRDKASILKPGSELLDIESLKAPVRTVLEGAYLRNAPSTSKSSGGVVELLEAALSAFDRSRDFRGGVLEVVNLGHDSDIAAAVYGQLAGAFYGVNAIPGTWRNSLMRKDLLEETAGRLLASAMVERPD
ncbi:MAG: ADP-ribosylglycohydrolase family protein [Proteobacteria bacterium]|nr:ADP-ribosylglycohydrolase family protein [Pseudomonadota bacterium]